jgi:N-dimethylarginine dimethylaminohydrolase
VDWTINPHMRIGAVDSALACAQHARFARALRQAGATVLRLPFLHGAFDSVFTKDVAILFERDGVAHALPTTFKHDQRQVETLARQAQLARVGFSVAAPIASTLEGGDVQILPHRGLALLGHGVRSTRDSAAALAQAVGCEVVSLELRDPDLFHLDTALTVLGDDTLLYCAEAFTGVAQRQLMNLSFRRSIAVSLAEAKRFALNVVEVGSTIVTGIASPEMAACWSALGTRVVETPLDQFQLSGGSAACLTARVTSLRERRARAAA